MQSQYTAKEYSLLKENKSASIIFGGTFDPIHEAHIADIKFLVNYSKRVFIAPTTQNPWKTSNPTDLDTRLEMIRLVLDYEKLEYSFSYKAEDSPIIIIEEPYTYSVDLIKKLNEQGFNKLYWAVGEDLKDSSMKWKNWNEGGVPLIVLPFISNFSATSVRNNRSSAHPAIRQFIVEHNLY